MARWLFLVLTLLATSTAAQPVIRAEPELQPRGMGPAKAAAARHARPERVFPVALARPTPEELAASLAPVKKAGTPLQIGFGRPVAALRDFASMRRALSWDVLPSGAQVAAIAIESPDAAAMRVELVPGGLSPNAILRFYGAADEPVVEVPARQVLDTIARNLAAGDQGPDARTYVSPLIEGSRAVVEIELPAGESVDALQLGIPAISHLVTSPRRDYVMPKASGVCENDVMCSSDWAVERQAVARMIFHEKGHDWLCTGTLLADLDAGSAIPYFLTANHCISTQTVASTLNTDWFYRSTACDSGVERTPRVTLTDGATKLYASSNTDTSFLRLNDTPPDGAGFAGWIAGPAPPVGMAITGIHHPAGDLQKISFGDIAGYETCTAGGGGNYSCSPASAGAATFYSVVWRDGVTEGGSSGSPIFDDAGKYVRGQLYGGGSFCTDPTAPDDYGRFDVAFNAALKQWLAPPQVVSVASRKFHAGTSTFDLPIDSSVPVTGAVSVEPRMSGTAGHQVVFTFDATVTLPGAAISTGANGSPLGAASPMAAANEVIVTLSGIPATTRVKVTLTGVNGSGASYSASVGLLVGDVDNPLLAVDSIDVDGIKAHSGSAAIGDVYPFDLNLSGAVTAADILVAKGRVGLTL